MVANPVKKAYTEKADTKMSAFKPEINKDWHRGMEDQMEYFHGKNDELARLLTEEEPITIKNRRHFHAHPELGGQEKETSAYVRREAEALGLPIEKVGDYGLIVRIDGRKPGRCVMLRADMDALPVQENPCNLVNPRVCQSENPGVMHACGHDGHTAMLLSAMRVLAAYRDHFRGTILCCFEQDEENIKGVHPMMKALEKYPVDTCWGMHVYYALETGKLDVSPGPRLAACSGFQVTIHGHGGHGSRPDLCDSPITCGVQMIQAWENFWTMQKHPAEAVTLGIGMFSGGKAHNVIPDDAVIRGSMRFFDMKAGLSARKELQRIAEGVASLNRCQAEVADLNGPVEPVINDAACSDMAREAVICAVGEEHVGVCEPWYVSESMAYYMNRYPGVFGLLGIKNPELGSGANHHTAEFDLDEDALKLGVAATVSYALKALAQSC